MPVYDVVVFSGPQGLLLTGAAYRFGKITLQPTTEHEFRVRVPRPGAVEIAQGATTPTFSAPWLVAVRYGRRLLTVEHPAAPFSSDAVRIFKRKLTSLQA